MKLPKDCSSFFNAAFGNEKTNEESPLDLYTKQDWESFGMKILYKGKELDTIVIPRIDNRRNANPMLFQPKTANSFNEFRQESKTVFQYSKNSFLIYRACKRDKVLMSAEACEPEPRKAHFEDIFHLLHQLGRRDLMVMMNLVGSGASLPQQFHAQIYRKQDPLRRLWGNFVIDDVDLETHQKVLRQIIGPLWGLELRLKPDLSPTDAAEQLFELTQHLRLRSQLQLSYNIYVDSAYPNVIRILYRENWKERPFYLREVQKITKKYSSSDQARAIRASPNNQWRWGWLECIGGLPVRDNSFVDKTRFGPAFWKEVLEFMSLPLEYREALLSKLGFQRRYVPQHKCI